MQVSWLQSIYGDPIVGAFDPEKESLVLTFDDFVGACVRRGEGGSVGVGAYEDKLGGV